MNKLTKKQISSFQLIVYDFYNQNKRNFPWRETKNPYHILVSEIMLQQTQVDRAIKKYNEFIKEFPTIQILAQAPLSKVLSVWSGLGYNRRGKFLWEAAIKMNKEYGGKIPRTISDLIQLPGIGKNTAAAILAYAFNKPVVYIETNIRTIFLYHFFRNQKSVDDSEIIPLIEQTLDTKNPRKWYSALMDYGTYVKRKFGNENIRSKQYVRQSRFEGSFRQKRAKVLRILLGGGMSRLALVKESGFSKEDVEKVLDELINEGFVVKEKQMYKVVD